MTTPQPPVGPIPATIPPASVVAPSRSQWDWRIESLGWRGFLGILGIVALADTTLYPSTGFTGFACFSLLTPLLLWLGSRSLWPTVSAWLLLLAQLFLSTALVWCGGPIEVLVSIPLLTLIAMAIAGRTPQILGGIDYFLHALIAGIGGVLTGFQGRPSHSTTLNDFVRKDFFRIFRDYLIPLGAVLAFAFVFIHANPQLSDWLDTVLSNTFNWLASLVELNEHQVARVVFWGVVAWLAFGMLRPLTLIYPERPVAPIFDSAATMALHAAFRNTLIGLNALFAIYLIFEFATLWFRDFPEGFHYSGYAHRGAFWLTCALALATVVLTIIFNEQIQNDPRAPLLFRLAKIWAALNFVLAIAVYHRMWIYIDFNGMTRMRVVGLLGISTVVAGFCIVLWKITHRRDFLWMLRGDLWALAIACYLFAITPVDLLVMRYNVSRILRGDEPPSVQISVHPIDDDGLLALFPLLEIDNPTIRDGIAALLETRRVELASEATDQPSSWKVVQFSTERLKSRLVQADEQLESFQNPDHRVSAFQRFKEYAYQWY